MAQNVFDLINFGNPVFASLVFWTAALTIKMLAMAPATAYFRMKNKVFANEEDTKMKGGKVKFNDDDVERVRRAHRNDMENIFLFIIIGFFYVCTNPPQFMAITMFRIAGISRIVHSIVYIGKVPQPARAIAFFLPLGVTAFMAFRLLMFTL